MKKTAVIRKCKEKDITDNRPKDQQIYCLYSRDGKKLLGRHPTKESAEKQMRLVEMKKHGIKKLCFILEYLSLFN